MLRFDWLPGNFEWFPGNGFASASNKPAATNSAFRIIGFILWTASLMTIQLFGLLRKDLPTPFAVQPEMNMHHPGSNHQRG